MNGVGIHDVENKDMGIKIDGAVLDNWDKLEFTNCFKMEI